MKIDIFTSATLLVIHLAMFANRADTDMLYFEVSKLIGMIGYIFMLKAIIYKLKTDDHD